jgi:predicted site-specific integrase-resolvase
MLSALDLMYCEPEVSVDSEWAAMHLGVSTRTLRNYRNQGVIRAFALPSSRNGKVFWRYLLSDLDQFIESHRNRQRHWDPEKDSELPVAVAARIMGVTRETAHVQRSRGKLKDYRPETVRAYLLKSHSRKVAREVKRRAQWKESNLRLEISRLRAGLDRAALA